MSRRVRSTSPGDAQALGVDIFGRLASDGERLGRFLTESGLDPRSIRAAASGPGFFPAVLAYVCANEPLLVEIAAELDRRPDEIAAAMYVLNPEADGDP